MPEFIREFIFILQTSPPDQLANLAFFWITPFLVFAVCVWGFLQIWINHRQGQFASKMKWVVMSVSVPQDAIQTPKGIENFFTALSGTKSGATFKEKWFDGKFQPYFSFELVSDGGRVNYYVRMQEKHRDFVEAALYAQYPEAQFSLVEDYAEQIPMDYPNDDFDLWGAELVLKNDDFLPMRTWESFEHQGEKDIRFKDPLLNTLETLGAMREGEHFYIQLLIMPPDDQSWTKGGQKQIDKLFGKPEPKKKKGMFSEMFGWIISGFLEQSVGMVTQGGEVQKEDDFRAFKITPFEKDVIEGINQKIGKIGWVAKIRFIYWAKKEVMRKGTAAPMAKGLFAQYTHQSLNGLSFVPSTIPQDDYPWQEWAMPKLQRALAKRYKDRDIGSGATPKIMNVEELATLWHFPAADARTPVMTSVGARQAEAPVELVFAPPMAPLMSNMDRSEEDGFGQTAHLPARKPLSVPGVRAQYPGAQNQPSDANMVSAPAQKPAPQPVETSRIPAHQAPGRPDLSVKIEKTITKESHPTPSSLPPEEAAFVPKPGMPAPLPPGLDLSDQPIPDDYYEPPTR